MSWSFICEFNQLNSVFFTLKYVCDTENNQEYDLYHDLLTEYMYRVLSNEEFTITSPVLSQSIPLVEENRSLKATQTLKLVKI